MSYSPYRSTRTTAANQATDTINAIDVVDYVAHHLIKHPANPKQCTCGWYLFTSSICGHQVAKVDFKCGTLMTVAGKGGFCKVPAPQTNIDPPRMNAVCGKCDYSSREGKARRHLC
jgi:hypothetical protein